MRHSIDVAGQVSPELSALIERMLADPDVEEALTLGRVRRRLAETLPAETEELETRHPGTEREHALLEELDALIEKYTDEAPAIDFVSAAASEPLSRVIEAVMNDPNRPPRPTLARVREALAAGLAARLVGEGALEEDEEEPLLAEVDSLIERFGADALAENFLRYE
ncbi:MAG: hypothetical protein RML56_13375 [Burkholderiales bacterium]|nr:hypothetical protein [Burkholderiales bacterium]